MKNLLYGVGMMSGTSLDGIDLTLSAYFEKEEGGYGFEIIKAECFSYSDEWRTALQGATKLSAYDFIKLHRRYGTFIGQTINRFLESEVIVPDFVASHGHTTFHEPHNNISFQIGDGATIASVCGIKTVSDFRTLDIALGGQGAPLVPVGDMELFADYDVCVNLGGFANLSYFDKKQSNTRIAYDICPVNIVLNLLVKELGVNFDEDGLIGRKGSVDLALLEQLNNLDFYKMNPPKSLGLEWVKAEVLPLIGSAHLSTHDLVATFYHHIATQIGVQMNGLNAKTALFTGGGAHNGFLMELIRGQVKATVIVPDKRVIDFKEALIFGFLGYLRLLHRPNALASVTGARENSSSGVVNWL